MKYVTKFSTLWHTVGSKLRDEMYHPKYHLINDLTMIDLSIIQTIEEYPKIIFKDLTDYLGIPKSTLTSAIKRLEKQGFVQRTQSLNDGRQFELTLTPMGSIAQSQHIQTETVVFNKLLDGLNQEDQKTFINLFDKALKKQDH